MSVMDLLEFSGTFVYSARMFIEEGPGLTKSIFTSRQSQAIGSLGTARILRTGEALDLKDLVELAVITSPPKAHKYAEMIAFRILLGDERELFKSFKRIARNKQTDIKPKPSQYQNQKTSINVISDLDLDHILKLLNLQTSVKQSQMDKTINFLNKLENELFHQLPENYSNDNMKWAKAREAFDLLGGRQGLLDREISDKQSLIQRAEKELIQSIPYINEDGLVKATILDQLDQIGKLSQEDQVKNQVDAINLMKKKFNQKKTSDLINRLSERELDKLNNLSKLLDKKVEQLRLDSDDFIPSATHLQKEIQEKLRQNARTLDDILKQPELFKSRLNYDQMEQILDDTLNSSKGDPLDLLSKATEVDNQLHTNFADKLSRKLANDLDQLSFDDLVDQPVNHPSWLQKMEEKFNKPNSPNNWKDLWNKREKLEQSKQNASSNYVRNEMDKLANSTLEDLIKNSKTDDQLSKSVEWAKDKNLKRDTRKIKRKAEDLGMSNEQIAKLIGEAYEIMKMMIESEDPSFERMNSLIPAAKLNGKQTNKLIKLSIDKEAAGAVAGFTQHNFHDVINNMNSSKKHQELMEKAIGAGGGENLLKEWYKHGSNMPAWMRDLVKKVAKQILIDQGKKRASMLMGSSEAGPLPEGSIRPYNIGDDPDTIDLEESLENILSLGKTIDQVKADDLIIRKTVTGRRCVIFLIDISGSMSGQPIASAAMATVMLLYAFARDELGIALFESSTHVICELNQPVEIDEIADEILDLKARGGTQMQVALSWAEKQFIKSKSEDKMFLMITDAMIGDFNRSANHLENIAEQGATSVLCIPANSYGLGNIQNIVNASKSQVVTIKDWRAFPDQISEILSRG